MCSVFHLINRIQNNSKARYCKNELLLMMIREGSGRMSSLFDCKYIEGVCLDRRHIVLTQS